MECPPIECRQSDSATGALDKKTEVTGSDRTLAMVGPRVQLDVSVKTLASVKRPDTGRVSPVSADVR